MHWSVRRASIWPDTQFGLRRETMCTTSAKRTRQDYQKSMVPSPPSIRTRLASSHWAQTKAGENPSRLTRLVAARQAPGADLHRIALASRCNTCLDPYALASLCRPAVGNKLRRSLLTGVKHHVAVQLIERLQRLALVQRLDHVCGTALGGPVAHHRHSRVNRSNQHGVIA